MSPSPDLSQLIGVVKDDAPSSELLDQLVMASKIAGELQELSDLLLGHFVELCRSEGLTWLEISAALGVTKQAAHRRFADSVSFSNPGRSEGKVQESELERAFAESCRSSIAKVQELGFQPGGWISLINQMGASKATHHLLSTGTVLPLFHFLVGAQRTDLAVEQAVLMVKWKDLFDDDDRAEARRRLLDAGVKLKRPS